MMESEQKKNLYIIAGFFILLLGFGMYRTAIAQSEEDAVVETVCWKLCNHGNEKRIPGSGDILIQEFTITDENIVHCYCANDENITMTYDEAYHLMYG